MRKEIIRSVATTVALTTTALVLFYVIVTLWVVLK